MQKMLQKKKVVNIKILTKYYKINERMPYNVFVRNYSKMVDELFDEEISVKEMMKEEDTG